LFFRILNNLTQPYQINNTATIEFNVLINNTGTDHFTNENKITDVPMNKNVAKPVASQKTINSFFV
jgi:archaellum component FlaG (FlaF/FlaG flagellin family)